MSNLSPSRCTSDPCFLEFRPGGKRSPTRAGAWSGLVPPTPFYLYLVLIQENHISTRPSRSSSHVGGGGLAVQKEGHFSHSGSDLPSVRYDRPNVKGRFLPLPNKDPPPPRHLFSWLRLESSGLVTAAQGFSEALLSSPTTDAQGSVGTEYPRLPASPHSSRFPPGRRAPLT